MKEMLEKFKSHHCSSPPKFYLICVNPVIEERIKTSEVNNHIDFCVVVYPISVINRKFSGHQFISGSYLLSAALQLHTINKIIVTLFRGN